MNSSVTLLLRLFLTPFLIAGVSLAGRRWGPAVSGWLIGFPLTSGPISIILALQHNPDFAARAAVGNLGGMASICVFCLVYTLLARRFGWLACALGAGVSFFISIAVWNSFSLALLPTLAVTLAINALVIRLMPRYPQLAQASALPRWDLPARMLIAMLFVLLVTGFSSFLGPQLSGLITPYPVFGSILAAFAHHQQGPQAAVNFLRGHLLSLFGFAAFFLVVGGLLTRLGIPLTYLLATLAVLGVNGVMLRVVRPLTPAPLPAGEGKKTRN